MYLWWILIDHLHASENILIDKLIAVTSRLDVVVTSHNVLRVMEIWLHYIFKWSHVRN